jgi:hypothetical protein
LAGVALASVGLTGSPLAARAAFLDGASCGDGAILGLAVAALGAGGAASGCAAPAFAGALAGAGLAAGLSAGVTSGWGFAAGERLVAPAAGAEAFGFAGLRATSTGAGGWAATRGALLPDARALIGAADTGATGAGAIGGAPRRVILGAASFAFAGVAAAPAFAGASGSIAPVLRGDFGCATAAGTGCAPAFRDTLPAALAFAGARVEGVTRARRGAFAVMIFGNVTGGLTGCVAALLARLPVGATAEPCNAPTAARLALEAAVVTTIGGAVTRSGRSGNHVRRLHQTANPAGIASTMAP